MSNPSRRHRQSQLALIATSLFATVLIVVVAFGRLNAAESPAINRYQAEPAAAIVGDLNPLAGNGVPVEQDKTATGELAFAAEPAQKVFRSAETRRKFNDAKLAAAGIHRYESRRLRLYTDLPADDARPLPALVDEVYEHLQKYFGPLPPAQNGADYQMTGFVMTDSRPFVEHDLVDPGFLKTIVHGKHFGNEFWMHDPPTKYYREHLMLHEVTHCYMTATPHPLGSCAWYMEGMAELFGLHRKDGLGGVEFMVFPTDRAAFSGFDRIRLLHAQQAAGAGKTADDVLAMPFAEFTSNVPYGWSWALCHFLNSHPRYRDRFRRLSQVVAASRPNESVKDLFADDWNDLSDEFLVFVGELCFQHDLERTRIDFQPGEAWGEGDERVVDVRADRGWQSTRLTVRRGDLLNVVARGTVVLQPGTRPWASEANGISLRYAYGRPIGQLLAAVRPNGDGFPIQHRSLLRVVPLGNSTTVEIAHNGVLYLRVNELNSDLGDNSGSFDVTLQRHAAN